SSAWVVSVGACRLLSKGERGNADSSPTQRAPHTSTQPGRHRPESVVVIDRNRWSSSTETAGRHRPEPVVVFNRNDWSSSTENSWSPSAGVRKHAKAGNEQPSAHVSRLQHSHRFVSPAIFTPTECRSAVSFSCALRGW